MKPLLLTLTAIRSFHSPIFSDGIEGRYSCVGTDPDGERYTGTVTIKQTGEAYSLKWTIDGNSHTGTGILTDKVLSASWMIDGPEDNGIVSYKVTSNGKLVGKWPGLGEDKLSTETLTPIK